jgi:hypothetical protein
LRVKHALTANTTQRKSHAPKHITVAPAIPAQSQLAARHKEKRRAPGKETRRVIQSSEQYIMVTTPASRAGAQRLQRPDPKTVRAKKREIAIRYAAAWSALNREGKISKSRMMTLIRLRELECLYAARHGNQWISADDAGREYLEIAAHHIAHLRGEVEAHIIAWAKQWAPWLPTDEAEELARRVAAKPRKWRADSLGRELNLTPEERDALSISTIRPAGWTKKQIDKANQEKRKARAHDQRLRNAKAKGRILRARPGRPRRTSPQLWDQLGMARATYYRTQIVERFRSHVSDEIDLAMENRRGDFVLMRELSRTLNGMTQIIEMWRLSRPL